MAAAPAPLSIAELLVRLRDPRAGEELSPLGGAGWLLVDVATDSDATDEALVSAGAALAALPCPTLALHASAPSRAGSLVVDAFDVAAADAAELEPVLAGVRRSPLAALVLVQLLRQSAALAPPAGLTAESLAYSTLQAGPEFAHWLASRGPARPRPAATEAAVLVRREHGRLRLTLNRPQRHNAFSAEMRDALCEGLALALADEAQGDVLLDGAGPSFSSGGDLDEFGTLPDPARAHAIRVTRSPAALLAALASRVTAQVQGACVGAGAELPAFAARVVARPDAWFQLPELALGLIPGAGGTVSLPRRIGRQRTAWLALSGERIDAATALRIGLVDEVE